MFAVDINQKAAIGDSISINGVCLTVSKIQGTISTFDIRPETLKKTNLGSLSDGSQVNIELALKADERFGGHFVLGHIDGIATIKKIEKQGDFAIFSFKTSSTIWSLKGSVTVDGISLIIASLDADRFNVIVRPV